MQSKAKIKAAALKAVVEDGRLIGDVAQQYSLSKRTLYRWLTQKGNTRKDSVTDSNTISFDEVASLKNAIKLLQSEVNELKSELNQYHITETICDGRIQLSLHKLGELKHAG
ncbi:transposase [Aliikangiella sp. G2MR2-5]|uniref:transposase n=1 Tax=Aliikangiella sp. G2MR2-5 TaxID=2788943 RepID=UPI0018A9E329|nr:transposase [Aliikangiella sp. G2MR2-5]